MATYVPPFELFSTVISHTQDKKTVSTCTLAVKCNTKHHALMHELMSLLFTKPPTKLAHIQFLLSSIISIIGIKVYCNLIHDNNKHFNNIVTIPVVRVTNDHVDRDIMLPTQPILTAA